VVVSPLPILTSLKVSSSGSVVDMF